MGRVLNDRADEMEEAGGALLEAILGVLERYFGDSGLGLSSPQWQPRGRNGRTHALFKVWKDVCVTGASWNTLGGVWGASWGLWGPLRRRRGGLWKHFGDL